MNSCMLSPVKALFSALARNRNQAPVRNRDAGTLRDEVLEHGLTAERARAVADALEAEGRLLDAVEALTLANRLRRDGAIERRLVRLRRAAFADLDRSLPPPVWPPSVPEDPPGTANGPRVVTAAELTPGVLRNGILRHGCVLARGLVPAARVERLRAAVERSFEAYDATVAGRATPAMTGWFDPVEDIPDPEVVRSFGRTGQGVLAADSPRALYEFLETVREIHLDALIAGHLGERPTLSVEKTTLRRVDADTKHPEWHQDGAFLGDGIRTVNAWFALSRCGRDAPGLDIIPVRLERVLSTGAAGQPVTFFDWVVSSDTIARELPGVEVWRPEFAAGDVLLFDHLLLHRTANAPDMPNPRYGIESWFFASSTYPKTSTPIVV